MECVLADVFMLPTSSSTLTEDEQSITTVDAVVIDEQQLEAEYRHVPCNIQVPIEQVIECMLANDTPNDVMSTSSSLMTANDSSDADERIADLIVAEEEEDAWNAAKRGDLDALEQFDEQGFDWTLEDDFHCPPIYYACHSGAAINIGAVRFLLKVHPTTLPDDIYGRCRKNAINGNVVKLLDATQNGQNLSRVQLDELAAVSAEEDYGHVGLFLHKVDEGAIIY